MKQIIINSFVIILGLSLIILSNILGHIDPPFSIEATPFLLLIIASLINSPLYKQNFTLTIFYNFALLLFNDLFIRYYAGGIHDNEGMAWICLLSAIAFIFILVIMIIYSFSNDLVLADERKRRISTIFISALVTGIIYFTFISNI